jgi:hypothetical protein
MTELLQSGKKYHVFLSHAHLDAEVVKKLAVRLEDEAKFRVWVDEWVLVPGKSWQRGMARGLDEAGACAVFFGSKEQVGWFEKEIEKAMDRQAAEPEFGVIPVLLPGADIALIQGFLKQNWWVEFKDGIEDAEAFRRLVAGIRGESPGRPPATAQVADKRVFAVPVGRNPLFTGRGEELAELEATLKRDGVAALTGMGGAGKTQTAVEFCYLHRESYEAVLWAGAESAAVLAVSLAKLAEPLGLPVQAQKVEEGQAIA